MSYTTIIALYPNEKYECLEELPNSHGSAPVIWEAMCQKYYGSEPHHCLFDGALDKLWPRWKDLSIPEHQRAVLMMTYDKAYVAKKDYTRAANDIEKFFKDFPPDPQYVNHWPKIKEIFESEPDIPAIGFWCTSVSENPFAGLYDEEKDEEGQPEWDEFYSIYDELNKITLAKA